MVDHWARISEWLTNNVLPNMWNSGIIPGGFRGILYFDGLFCLQGSGWKQGLQLTPIRERFVLADGSEMRKYDQASMTLAIGSHEYDVDVVIADLGYQSAMWRLDFLEDQNTVLKVPSGTLLMMCLYCCTERRQRRAVVKLEYMMP